VEATPEQIAEWFMNAKLTEVLTVQTILAGQGLGLSLETGLIEGFQEIPTEDQKGQ